MNGATLTADQIRQSKMLREDGVPESIIVAIFTPPGSVGEDPKEAARLRRISADNYVPLSDDEWGNIGPHLPDAPQAQIPLRSFFESLLWKIANDKRSWTAIPTHFGDADALRQRFARIAVKTDAFQTLAGKVRGQLDADREKQVAALGRFAEATAARRSRQQKIR